MPTLANDLIASRAAAIIATRQARDIHHGRGRQWWSVGAVMVCLGLSNGFALWVAAAALGLGVVPHLLP